MTVGAFIDRDSGDAIRWRRWDTDGRLVAVSDETFRSRVEALDAAVAAHPDDEVDQDLAWPR